MRPELGSLPAYRPGRSTAAGGRPAHKLSSNELPYGPLPSVRQAIADRLDVINRYPDMAAAELIARLAERHSVRPEEVALGAGSVEVVSQLIRALAGPGDEVLFAWRSFEAYPLLTIAAGATPVQVANLPGERHDVAAMAAAVTERTRLVMVCTPNNPTGPVVTSAELATLLATVPPEVTVLVDEAYVEFVTDPAAASGDAVFSKHPNVVVARTFSKAYGLAGLRVGYGLAPVALAAAMRTVAVPFGVTALAQAAALASLDATDELAERVGGVLAERDRVGAALAELGWRVPETQSNFFWLPAGEATDALAEAFVDAGVLVRPFSGDGIRVSVGTREADDAMLGVLTDVGVPPSPAIAS